MYFDHLYMTFFIFFFKKSNYRFFEYKPDSTQIDDLYKVLSCSMPQRIKIFMNSILDNKKISFIYIYIYLGSRKIQMRKQHKNEN
jgi:hypothetical protein